MEAQKYFQSYKDYFWEWEQSGDGLFVTIPNVKTIAHEAHIIEVLDCLSEDTIPPFGALLLALTATHYSVGDSFDGLLYYVRKKERIGPDNQCIPDLNAAISFLEKLQSLRNYKKGTNKLLLFSTIFSECHNRISSEKAKLILQQYHEQPVSLEKKDFNEATFINDFKVFELLNKKFPTTDSLLVAMQGLPVSEVEEQLQEEVLEQVVIADDEPKDLIEQLIEEDMTFHVGSLVKRIWSGLNIPLHHNMPSSQPLGGISDLTNKGDFDKLLISEFAQDDMVFMSRIANNEALYIQREVPPEADRFERIILVDTTLRNWGNPKIMGFATALAIAKHPKTDINCRFFALGDSFNEVYYETVDQVIEGLGFLSGKADCSTGLSDYLFSNEASTSQEIFFITSEESLKFPSIQKVMGTHFDALKYVVTTHANGTINIYRSQNKGRNHLQRILLPLEALWSKNTKEKKKQKKQYVSFISGGVNNYPMYFPLSQNTIVKFYLDDKYYFLTNNKSLVVTYVDLDKNDQYHHHIPHSCYKGNTILFENVSIKSGGVYGLGRNTEGDYIVYGYYQYESILFYLNLNTREYAKTNFESESRHHEYKIFNDGNVFYFLNLSSHQVWKMDYLNESINIELIVEPKVLERSVLHTQKLDAFSNQGTNILKNFNSISITTEDFLQFNTRKLAEGYGATLHLYQDRSALSKIKAVRNKNAFVFPDGSEVLLDKRGMLTLVSSNQEIPKIYIAPVLQLSLAVSTDEEFAGNNYFYDEEKGLKRIEISEFRIKYLERFVQQIVHYEV